MLSPYSNKLESLTRLSQIEKARLASADDRDIFLPQVGIDYAGFKRRVWKRYKPTPFHDLIDSYLTKIVEYLLTNGEQGINRLIVCMPPRYGKTENISRHFPAYVLGMMPDIPVISTSYGSTLAVKNGRSVRNLVKRSEYQEIFPHIKLDTARQAAAEWYIERYGGGLISAGIGGGITGHGGKLVIIDDPIKRRAEAESPTYREHLREWYKSDLYTRLEEPNAIILMMTRWHYDDLAGWLLGDNVDGWIELNLPALAIENDPLGRAVGEALWPAKHDRSKLFKIAAQMGEYAFASMFQQHPPQAKGALFDATKIGVLEYTPEYTQVVRFYDLAVTAKSRSSYTVGLKLGITADELLVVMHVWRAQKEIPDVHAAIKKNAELDGKSVKIQLEAEKGGIIETQYLLRDEAMRGFTIDAEPPEGDKYTRAGPVASRVNAGRVAMLPGDWNQAFLDELAMFPNGEWNDQVDALSGAYKMLSNPTKDLVFDNFSSAAVGTPVLALDEPVIWGARDGYSEGAGIGTESYQPRVVLAGQIAKGVLTVFHEQVTTGEGYPQTIAGLDKLSTLAPSEVYIGKADELFRSALWNKDYSTVSVAYPIAEAIRLVRNLLDSERLIIHEDCTYLIYEFEHFQNDMTEVAKSGEAVPLPVNNRALQALFNMAWQMRYD